MLKCPWIKANKKLKKLLNTHFTLKVKFSIFFLTFHININENILNFIVVSRHEWNIANNVQHRNVFSYKEKVPEFNLLDMRLVDVMFFIVKWI